MSFTRRTSLVVLCACLLVSAVPGVVWAQNKADGKDLAFQLAENPPMQLIMREVPPLPEPTGDFEVREGFTLIETLDEFRAAIKEDNQKIRLKPGHYVAEKVDPPVTFTKIRPVPEGKERTSTQEQVFAVTGSDNHFDLRGVVITIPSSVKDKLTRKVHHADNWRIAGSGNTFEGAYFRTDVDIEYPNFFSGGNLFEVVNDGNTFLDCIFHVKGSSPFGYTDFYGKGRKKWTRLDKHAFMSLEDANNTTVKGCEIYNHAFGHGIHFHKVDGVLIEDCLFSGALRPTRDIFKEKVGVAREHKFKIMYRGERPIPRNEVIPITEDAIRTYNEVQNVVVRDTIVERHRGSLSLYCVGDVTVENTVVRECGDSAIDVTAKNKGKVVVKNVSADLAYNPMFRMRTEAPYRGYYEVTILSPADDVIFTPRSNLGQISGIESTFILHDGTTKPLPKKYNVLICGGNKPLTDSTVTNYTAATLILEKNVTGCTIQSVGPVKNNGKNNTIIRLKKGTTAEAQTHPDGGA